MKATRFERSMLTLLGVTVGFGLCALVLTGSAYYYWLSLSLSFAGGILLELHDKGLRWERTAKSESIEREKGEGV